MGGTRLQFINQNVGDPSKGAEDNAVLRSMGIQGDSENFGMDVG